MTIKKKKGFNIDFMLEKFSETRKINVDGSTSTRDPSLIWKYESYFMTALEARGKSDAFMSIIIKEALRAEQVLNEQSFIRHCNRLANTKENNAKSQYKVVFPIWGSTGLIEGRKKWNNVTITFGASQASSFMRRAKVDRAKQIKSREGNFPTHMPNIDDLPLAVCSLHAISVHEAFELAENAISKELGLFSLFLQRGRPFFDQNSHGPISTTLLAPHMTVHDLSGKLSSDIFWYNQWPKKMQYNHLSNENACTTQAKVEKIRKKFDVFRGVI
ncbi:MAG: hypothetical protein P8Q99_15390 [Paracoccaceae bacterium]|nr:hypothetical protein [Paracoccaceae bacterium]